MSTLVLTGDALTWDQAMQPLAGPVRVRIASSAKHKMTASRQVVESILSKDTPIYSINTGFGNFARTSIAPKDRKALQKNLVMSHAAGVGPVLPDAVVRLMMLLKLQGLVLGYSGVRPLLAEALAAWISADALPEVPAQGSVGASGDLAPLAHMTLPLIGQGRVRVQGRSMTATRAAKAWKLPIVTLQEKEGLGLLNGTQAMLAVGLSALNTAQQILLHANIAGALTIEGLLGSMTPFDARLHAVRSHPGAVHTAAIIRALVAKSDIVKSHRDCHRVQDPYALRCIPSVHGSAYDAWHHTQAVVEREVNSVTDNPIVFSKTEEILSGGNFHGAPLALAFDHLAIAITTLASISERRIEHMVNPKADELPVKGLVATPGLHSGFMVAHTTAASLVSENKTLAHPASVDTIPTWAGQEDHVSMGMWGARKLHAIVENALHVVAIELLAACQAIDLHPTRHAPGRGTKRAYAVIREYIPMLKRDRVLTPDIATMVGLIRSGEIARAVESRLSS